MQIRRDLVTLFHDVVIHYYQLLLMHAAIRRTNIIDYYRNVWQSSLS